MESSTTFRSTTTPSRTNRDIGSNRPLIDTTKRSQIASENPRSRIGDTRVCMGTTDALNKAWTKVRTEEDVRSFYKEFYPAYPDQFIDAIVLRLNEKLEKVKRGDYTSKDLFNGKVRQPKEGEWDFEAELEQQRIAGQTAKAMKNLDELNVS